MNAYLHPGFHKPQNTTDRAVSLEAPARTSGLFLDDTVAVNPFINVPRLAIFLQMSSGKSAGSICGVYRTPSTSNGRQGLSRQAQVPCQLSSAQSCTIPTGQSMLHSSLTHSAVSQYPIQLPPHQIQVQLQPHSAMAMARQTQNIIAPRSYNNERDVLFSAQDRERQLIHLQHSQEQSRTMQQPNRVITATRAFTKDEGSSHRHPSYVPPFPYAGNPTQQQFSTQKSLQRPFSCFGANGLYSTYPAPGPGPVSLTLPGHFLDSGAPRHPRSSAPMHQQQQQTSEPFCMDISSPVSVSDRFSPSHSPGPRSRIDQHLQRVAERAQQVQEVHRDEESDRVNVQQFNQMVRLRHSSSSSASGSSNSHTMHLTDDTRDLSMSSPSSTQYNDDDHTEMSYLDDELQKYFPHWGRQNPILGCLEPAARPVPYFVMA